jgi:hypothetical protein
MKTLIEYSELLDENRQRRLDLVEQLATNRIDQRRFVNAMYALASREAKEIAFGLGKVTK